MAKAKKSYMIVGNWKMNPQTLEEARSAFSSISKAAAKYRKVKVVIAPPAPFIVAFSKKASPILVSSQDVSAEASGAFTGSYSAHQVKSSGATYAIVGHSERRAAGDSDEIVVRKVNQALSAGLSVVVCVGESIRDEEARYLRDVRSQVLAVLSSIDKRDAKRIVVAYEPVWAVGKSYDKAPKPSDIHEMSIYIKKSAAEILGKKQGLRLPVLYGGSVDLKNARDFLSNAEIDGLLVGRQSLDPSAFVEIITYASKL